MMGKFWDWLNRDEPRDTVKRAAEPIVIPTRDAGTVTSGNALELIDVYRAVQIRATAVRQLSLDVERGGNIIPRPAIIRRPSLNCTLGAFLEQTMLSGDLTGNAYWRIRRDSAGTVNSVEVLNPHDVAITYTNSGRVTGYQHRGVTLSPDEVRHLPKMRVPGTPYGLGPIQAARVQLGGALELRDYAARAITGSDVPSGLLTFKTPISDAQAAQAREAWTTTHGGTRGVAVLGGDAGYTPIYLSPADAQWLESQQWTTTNIARLFGVPGSLMLSAIQGNSMTYSNVSQEWVGFIRFGLATDLAEIEEAFTDLLPRGQRARFNVEALLRMDTATRYAAHASALGAGWLTPNEVREIEGYPPIDGGNVLSASKPKKETAA